MSSVVTMLLLMMMVLVMTAITVAGLMVTMMGDSGDSPAYPEHHIACQTCATTLLLEYHAKAVESEADSSCAAGIAML